MRAGRHLLRPSLVFLSLLGAVALGASCGGGDELNPAGTGGAGGGATSTTTTTATTTTAGPGGGCGDDCGTEELLVGAARRTINPTIVESDWQDLDNNSYYDPGEPFTDVNNNGVFDATWIAGFGTGRPAIGQHDDLEIRTLAISYKGRTIVFCVLDAVGYFLDEMDLIRDDARVQALGVDHITISSTHTHEGVDTVGLWGPDPVTSGLNPAHQAMTRDQAAAAIADAVAAMKPARMRIAQTVTAGPGGTLDYVNDTRDPIIYDPTLTIARFTAADAADDTIATLVNWAAHPEYTGSKNNLLSADYVHWLREVIEQGVPADGIAGLGGTTVFVQGPLGGQVGPGGGVHPVGPGGVPISQSGLAKAEAAGTNVAKLALRAIEEQGEDVDAFDITYRTALADVRIDNLGYHFLVSQGVLSRQLYNYDATMPIDENNLPWARTRITYLQVGPLATITAPGELHPELWVGGYDGSWSWGRSMLNEVVNAPNMAEAPAGPYLREIMLSNPGVKYAFVSGLAEDFLGYIVPSFNYVLHPDAPYFLEADGDHYEETNSVGPLCEEHIQHPMMDLAKPAP